MPLPVYFFRHRRALFLALALALVALLAVLWSRWSAPHNPLLDSPALALASLQAKSLYFNARARPWLLRQRSDLLTADDRDETSERSRTWPQAVLDPKLFRHLDRTSRFDALLLVGDPSEYRPLLDHLAETKDWTLRYVDHMSMVFRRDDGRPWQLKDFDAVRARFAQSTKRERAVVLAEAAIKLLAIRQAESAKALLDEAAELAPRDPFVANGLATYYMGRGEWSEASEQVERALSEDSDFLPAMGTKTQLLYGMKRFNEAYALSSELLAKLPEEPNFLFYHAKIAHEAHAYKAEIAALGKLIARAEADGRPIGGYEIYLGQACAAASDAKGAISAFMLALNDPDLPDDQRAYARESIARIKQRTGQ